MRYPISGGSEFVLSMSTHGANHSLRGSSFLSHLGWIVSGLGAAQLSILETRDVSTTVMCAGVFPIARAWSLYGVFLCVSRMMFPKFA